MEHIRTHSPLLQADDVDPDAFRIIKRLQRFGYLAYLVGGSVRDSLLGCSPKDFDIATSARPEEVRALFHNCRLIGKRFRLAHIYFHNGKIIETATFRAAPVLGEDGDELIKEDNEFGTPESDVQRRDFSVNALFYDPVADVIIDYIGGLADLEWGILRSIGEPKLRFREDPVRMLRAIKFSARLGLHIEESCWEAIQSEGQQLSRAAIPRLLLELLQMLGRGKARRSLELLDQAGLLELILPEIAAFLGRPALNPWSPLAELLDALDMEEKPPEIAVQLALLFWPIVQELLEIFKPESPGRKVWSIAETLIEPAAQRLCIPRKDVALSLAAITEQLQFEEARRRRSSRNCFINNSSFSASFALFQLRAQVEEIPKQIQEEWRQMAEQAPEPKQRSRGGGRRRRRRR